MQVCTTTEPITAEPHHSLHDNGTKVHGRISPQSAKLRAASHPLVSELNRTSYKMDNVSITCISMLQYSNSLKDKGNVATNITTIPTKACKSMAAIASIAIAKPHPGLQGNGAGILITMAEYNILQETVSVLSITIKARTQHCLKQRQHCILQHDGGRNVITVCKTMTALHRSKWCIVVAVPKTMTALYRSKWWNIIAV